MSPVSTCVVTSSFPRFAGDWAGHFVLESARLFEPMGPVQVLAPWDRACDPFYRPVGMRLERYSILNRHIPGVFYGGGGPENLQSPVRALQAPAGQAACIAAALLHAHRCARWVAHWMVPAGLAVALARRPHQAALLVVHGGGWHILRRHAHGRRLARFILSRMSHVICVAAYQREQILGLFSGLEREEMARRIRVSPMGLDVADYAVPRVPKPPGEPLMVLGVGRLTPIKGFDRLIRACRGLPVTLSLVGEGPERHALERLAAREGVRLLLPGAVKPKELLALYAQADMMALPSRPIGLREEGTPRVLLEAMAAGVPLVASRTGGIAEVIHHGENGLLENGEEADLRACLSMLCADANLRRRLGDEARTLAWAYDWRAIGPELLASFV